jgi:hypothetical protein
MSFLVVHDISDHTPYAILKVPEDATTRDVIKQAVAKAGVAGKSEHDYVLLEEVTTTKLLKGHFDGTRFFMLYHVVRQRRTRVARFFFVQYTNTVENIPNDPKITPKGLKVYYMAVRYSIWP